MKDILANVIEPAFRVLPPMMASDEARAMLLAIHLQEDPQQRRRQWPSGPARGLWQFERIGVAEVLRNRSTMEHAAGVCWKLGNAGTTASVYNQLAYDDVLACCFARLALWRFKGPLPKENENAYGWRQYLTIWAPGESRPDDWPENFRRAWGAVRGVA